MRLRSFTLFMFLLALPALILAQDPADPAQPTQPAADGVTLKWEAPEVGAVQVEKSATQWEWTLQIKLKGEVKAQAELGRIIGQHKRVQTLAVNGRAQSKVLVAYTEWKGMNTRSGAAPQGMELPGHGKSYVLENRTGEPDDFDIRTLDGKGVVLAEARSIAGDTGVGRIPMLAQLFDGKTLKKGDVVTPTAEQAERMWGARYISASYEFGGTRDEMGMHCAVFKAKIRTKMQMPNNSELTFNHEGEVLLMAETLWPVSVKFTGPIEVGGTTEHQAGTLEFGGTGKASTSTTFTYSAEMVPDNPGITMEPGTAHRPSVHDFTVTTLDGKEQKLSDYKGKVLLIVNVASKCGFTPQYKELEALYQKYKEKGLVILGFPCNDFGNQEPGSAEEIQKFCTAEYGVTFPLFSKITIAPGDQQSKLYTFMGECAGGLPRWNFFKYLVDAEGNVRTLWEPPVTPLSEPITRAIETLLAGGDSEGEGDGE